MSLKGDQPARMRARAKADFAKGKAADAAYRLSLTKKSNFWEETFLAALTGCAGSHTLHQYPDKARQENIKQLVRFAKETADEAVKQITEDVQDS